MSEAGERGESVGLLDVSLALLSFASGIMDATAEACRGDGRSAAAPIGRFPAHLAESRHPAEF